jgi:hypothetical protein
MLVFEENKPSCDDNYRNQKLFPNGWTVFEAPRVKKSLEFPELALAASVVAQ